LKHKKSNFNLILSYQTESKNFNNRYLPSISKDTVSVHSLHTNGISSCIQLRKRDTKPSGIQAYQICRCRKVSLKLHATYYHCNIVLIALTSDPRYDDFFINFCSD